MVGAFEVAADEAVAEGDGEGDGRVLENAVPGESGGEAGSTGRLKLCGSAAAPLVTRGKAVEVGPEDVARGLESEVDDVAAEVVVEAAVRVAAAACVPSAPLDSAAVDVSATRVSLALGAAVVEQG